MCNFKHKTMKVAAAAGIFCLIMTVVHGSVFRVRSEDNEVDGKKVTQCSIDWDGKKQTIDIGEELHLPSSNGGPCYDCGPCEKHGMECRQLLSGNDECPAYKPFIIEEEA